MTTDRGEPEALAPGAHYRGDLSRTSLPEMLYSIDLFGVAGLIEATRQGVHKRVFLRDGCVVHAASSDRRDSLGVYLRTRGRITDQEFVVSMRDRETSQKRFGELLVEKGILSPDDIYRAIGEQVEAIVWSLFYWPDGEVLFRLGDFQEKEMVRIQLPMRRVILEGIKRTPDARTLASRLGHRDLVLEPSYRAEQLIELGLDADEYHLLRLIDGGRTLYELCSTGPRTPAENAKLLYAFRVLRLVREPEAEAPREKPIVIRFNTAGDKFS